VGGGFRTFPPCLAPELEKLFFFPLSLRLHLCPFLREGRRGDGGRVGLEGSNENFRPLSFSLLAPLSGTFPPGAESNSTAHDFLSRRKKNLSLLFSVQDTPPAAPFSSGATSAALYITLAAPPFSPPKDFPLIGELYATCELSGPFRKMFFFFLPLEAMFVRFPSEMRIRSPPVSRAERPTPRPLQPRPFFSIVPAGFCWMPPYQRKRTLSPPPTRWQPLPFLPKDLAEAARLSF